MKLWIFLWVVFFSTIRSSAFSFERTSETLDARTGLFRLLSADIFEKDTYHFRTSLEFFQQDGLLKDPDDSSVRNTKTTLGFGYALTPHLLLSANGGFNLATRTPKAVGSSSGSETIDLLRGGLAATGTYDIGELMKWEPRRFTAGLSLWVDFSKISRFIDGPNIIPTAIFSSDFSDAPIVPYRLHLNAGFRPANGSRFYSDSAPVKDFDRFVTDTLNSWAFTGGFGMEFPFSKINPSAEIHMVKPANTGFGNSPMWVTVGLKGNPFPTKNIELFGGADIGLSSFTATASGLKPDAPVVPTWNAIVGFAVSQFGLREGETTVSQSEYDRLKTTTSEQENILKSLKRDIEYNTIQGQVIDANTKQPIEGVSLSFPESSDLKGSKTDADGKFVRYFKAFSGNRLVFSYDGYDASSKFLSLKPGEKVTVDIELRKASPAEQVSEFVATLTNENGAGVSANVSLTNVQTNQPIIGTSDSSGQVSIKVLAGTYRLDIKAPGLKAVSEVIEFQKGKTVLRSYSMSAQ